MKTQERRWFERDGNPAKPTRFDPKRTESGDQPIQNPEIGCTPARSVQDQQLMFGQNGFCHNSAHTSGLDQPETVVMRWTMSTIRSRMNQWYSSPKTTEFRLMWNSPGTG
jgi:hypothetical protein